MIDRTPLPRAGGDGPLPTLLRARHSVRTFSPASLSLDLVADLLWAAAGRTERGRRTVGSAHAHYPVATSLVAGAVEDLPSGAYHYRPENHDLRTVRHGDHRVALAGATIDAAWVAPSPAALVLSADLERANETFADQGPRRGERFALVEAGAIAQNVHLWAATHDLGTVFVGGLRRTVDLPFLLPHHEMLGILPIGRPADTR